MELEAFKIGRREECIPLILAVQEDENPKIVEMLLKAGGDSNLGTRNENWTSLHMAGWMGKPDVVQSLLKHGADPRAVTKDRRWTPFHVLAWSGGRGARCGGIGGRHA